MDNFDFSQNYILENERLLLRPLQLKDFDDLEAIANAPQIWTYFLEKGLGKANFEKYFHHALEQKNLAKEYPLLIYDKIKNQVAGITRLYDFIPFLKSIKIGHTWYGIDFQGTGVNTNCKYLLFEFIFEKFELERIGFGVHGENRRSIAALKKVGCIQEGVLRNFLPSINGNGRVDLFHFSILKDEWLNAEKEKLGLKLNYYK